MKKLLVILVSILTLLLAACGSTGASSNEAGIVTKSSAPAVSYSLELEEPEGELYKGEHLRLSAAAAADDGSACTVLWSSSDESVLTISDSGEAVAVAAGNAVVSAAIAEDPSVSASVTISVLSHVESVRLPETEYTLLTGSEKATRIIECEILPEDASNKTIIWTTSNEEIVAIDENGAVCAVAPGTATVTGYSEDLSCNDIVICNVTVRKGVSTVTLNEEDVYLYVGKTMKLTSTVLPADAENRDVQWSSSDESVVSVDSKGTLTPVGVGTANVLCSAVDGSEVSASCNVHVVVGIKSISLAEKNGTLLVGGSEALSTKKLEYTVSPEDTSFRDVTWTTSDETVAVVGSDGVVTGVAPGKATITAFTTDPAGEGKIKASYSVTVGNAVRSLSISGADSTVFKGTSKKLSAAFVPSDVYSKKVTWTSSNEAVLKVDANGNLKAVGTGKATITCAAEDGSGVSCSREFTVIQAVTALKSKNSSITLFEGQTSTVGADVTPSDATNKKVTWSSSNPSVASVDDGGTVTAKSTGSATITGTAADGSGKTCSVKITVEPLNPISLESLGFGVYNGSLLGLEFENKTMTKTITNVDFSIALYYQDTLLTSGSYNLGKNVSIAAGHSRIIKRTMSGVSMTTKVVFTITGVSFSDGTHYSIPIGAQRTYTFSRW